ncbi:substrate-binding domain-containing protein [Falsirhodobacter xinxiangensis]|uniref:substrate-binding domain-containing protein n=1 Tax=Falsirhodobacter xinxiangensis TaxID=2530049 RepID=UPI00145AC2EB|nr:substrate-binding domain-containing protein [Rhodobacter xinxiangensis]
MAPHDDLPIVSPRKSRAVDVAREAGVSTATVSRSFNEPDKVLPKVRERVMEAARKVGWLPHAAGSALARQRTLLVGTIIPTLRSGIFANFVAGLQERLGEEGITLLVSVSGNDPSKALAEARVMLSRGAEALSLVGQAYPEELFDLLSARSVPHVITHEFCGDGKHPSVGLDNREAFVTVTQHLLALGHRKFGLIMPDPKNNNRVAERIGGVLETLSDHGIAINAEHQITGEWSPQMGYDAAVGILNRMPPTAIICGNDQIAIGVLAAARARGFHVPGDLSVTGFDDDPVSEHIFPSLTSARTDNTLMGSLAAECLLDQLAGRQAKSQKLTLLFAERQSTSRPAKTDLNLDPQ